MKRFVVHALIFIALQAVLLAWAWRSCPDDPDHYMAASLDKHARLRTAAREPQTTGRLIFVGGSSMGFSVDSRVFVEQGLGLAPVNMGLNDGLGLAFMLGEVESSLRSGDVVVIAPEPHLLWTGSQNDAVWAVLQRRPASLRCLGAAGPRALADASDQGLHFFARKLRCAAHQMTTDRMLPTIYKRSSFDSYGDFVAHRGEPAKLEAPIDRPWPPPAQLELDGSIAKLARFARRCEAAGARCFLAWCPMRATKLAREAAAYELIEQRLREEVGLPFIETLANAGYPETDFYDRGPHLTGAAAETRSRRLAAELAEHLSTATQ